MLSRVEAGKRVGEDSGSGKLLHDIEAISKALYLDKTRAKSSTSSVHNRSKSTGRTSLLEPKFKPKDGNGDPLHKDKKSIWSWKALKAFTHVRHRRFNCCFSLQVHSIEGLPSYFDDLSLCVHWKRRDGELVTRSARVFQGIAEFEEQLTNTCSVYGSRNGPHHSAKYEAKHFLLYAAILNAPQFDLGKHRVDLTRLLPLTLEELEDEKSSGKWTTSFKLSGKAKGATMNVSFGYLVIGNNSLAPTANKNVPEVLSLKRSNTSTVKPVMKFNQSDGKGIIQRGGGLPSRSRISSRPEDIKDLHEVLPISRSELSSTENMLCQKFDEEKLDVSVDYKPELDVFSEPLEPLKPNSYLSFDTGKENVENVENECEDGEFSVTEHGIELSSQEQVKLKDGSLNTAEGSAVDSFDLSGIDSASGIALEEDTKLHPQVEELGSHKDELILDAISKEEALLTQDLLMKNIESTLNSVSDLVMEGLDSQEESEIPSPDNNAEVKSSYRERRKGKSLSLDAVTESVACEFLDMLGIEHSPLGLSSESEPESPRERLLRQFEKDTLASGCSLFNFDIEDGELAKFGDEAPIGSGLETFPEDFDMSLAVQAAEEKHNIATQAAKSKTYASVLEDLENETLMREWGLNEKAFQSSPPSGSGGFGSPIDLPPEEPLQLPPLGEGFGPYVQTENGGFLRSMNPALFRNAKSGGSLIMQVSSPVVVPAEMGSGIMEILQRLASVGIEKLSMQANKLMPLEDITGKTILQAAGEATTSLEGPERQVLLQGESEIDKNVSSGRKKVKGKSPGSRSSKFDSSSIAGEMDSEYVSLEDLAPLAMDKIEALSMEGLRIQSGMSDEDAPSNISPQSIGEFSALEGKRVNLGGSLGLEGAGGLQLLDIKDSGDDVDGLMGLSLTLDEWMKLDSGEVDDEDQISERTSKILAAHHATSTDLIHGRSKGEKKRGKGSSRKCGLLGNNFTVALMVQLRDPLRNYEPVGTPMLALIQVERVFVPPKPKIYSTVSEVRRNNEEDDESEPAKKEESKEEKIQEEDSVPQFKITEVHVAGLKAGPEKKKLWGSTAQQQSGSRWLLANGMGKSNKNPFMKSKAVAKSSTPATTTVQPGDTLWSISSRVHGTGAKWKELAALNPHIRNPNVIFPNEKIRLH
ncbi:protein PLASTID MOVEMENT IMPAIRED 1-RELATED 1 [Cornus florida]|uniref:protein PLASTID MOVEMENT IMPAIRED 1-RELATED 1 n=1 Tax=Cornus florida TaxID=4283 RepID=UPI00289D524E|nr:protein PLASTID MOVEMENT IMPAIRED 1-RELATED 1 [Cornus florida]